MSSFHIRHDEPSTLNPTALREASLGNPNSSAQLGTTFLEAVSPGDHSSATGEPEPTFVDHMMQTIGDPLKTGKKLIEMAHNFKDPLRACKEGVQSLAEAGENFMSSTTRSYYQRSLEDFSELREQHLARYEEFDSAGEIDLFNNLTAALDAILQAPENAAAQHRLWNLVEEAEIKVPTPIEAEFPPIQVETLPIEQPHGFAEVTLLSHSPLDTDPQEPQKRYTNLFQLRAFYLGVLQKMPEESELHEECKRLTDHFEATLKKGNQITDYDYRIAIVHKNWFRDWLSSPEINRSHDLPHEDIPLSSAQFVGYNISPT